ncbi:Ig-like domain-containing protein [Mitsuaria sp. GD03876]|nr:Ig-like domain-containing protein [Mitsuaria sp. GD03876]
MAPERGIDPTPAVAPEPVVERKSIVDPTPTVDPDPVVDPTPVVDPGAVLGPDLVVDPGPIVDPTPIVDPKPHSPQIDVALVDDTGSDKNDRYTNNAALKLLGWDPAHHKAWRFAIDGGAMHDGKGQGIPREWFPDDGRHTVQVEALDASGRVVSQSAFDFELDTRPPADDHGWVGLKFPSGRKVTNEGRDLPQSPTVPYDWTRDATIQVDPKEDRVDWKFWVAKGEEDPAKPTEAMVKGEGSGRGEVPHTVFSPGANTLVMTFFDRAGNTSNTKFMEHIYLDAGPASHALSQEPLPHQSPPVL